MAKSAKKEVAVKESPIQSHLKGEATNKRVASATRKAKQTGDAIKARLKQLQSSALALVNAHNAQDGATDAVSAARKSFYDECQQSFGKKFFDADKSITNQARVIFYKAHFESKGLGVSVAVNASRGEVKTDAVDATQTDDVKREADNAKSRFNKFIAWCSDEFEGKHKAKDPNNRQSNSKAKRTTAEIVQKEGARIYNACYKAKMLEACTALQAWATKHFPKDRIKYAVPAGQK